MIKIDISPLGEVKKSLFQKNVHPQKSIGEWSINQHLQAVITFYKGHKELVLDLHIPSENAVFESFCGEQDILYPNVEVGKRFFILESDFETMATPEV